MAACSGAGRLSSRLPPSTPARTRLVALAPLAPSPSIEARATRGRGGRGGDVLGGALTWHVHLDKERRLQPICYAREWTLARVFCARMRVSTRAREREMRAAAKKSPRRRRRRRSASRSPAGGRARGTAARHTTARTIRLQFQSRPSAPPPPLARRSVATGPRDTFAPFSAAGARDPHRRAAAGASCACCAPQLPLRAGPGRPWPPAPRRPRPRPRKS